jgi:hypothetical protein
MGYLVINDARKDARSAMGESEELSDLELALALAQREHAVTAEPLRVVHAETGRTLLYFGHEGFRCINRAFAKPHVPDAVYQLDGGFSRPFERIQEAVTRAATEYLSCIRRGIDAVVEVVDGAGRVYWRNGRPV